VTPVPGLVLLVLVPLVLGIVAALQHSSRVAFHLAWVASLPVALAGLVVLSPFSGPGWLDPIGSGRLGMEGVTAVAVALTGVLSLAVVVARPATWRDPREIGALVTTEALLVFTAMARNVDLLALGWILSFVPAIVRRAERHVTRRPIVLVAILSSFPIVLAWMLIAISGAPRTLEPTLAPLPAPYQLPVFLLVVMAAAVRMGLLPFTPLMVATLEQRRLGRAMLLVGLRPSVLLFLLIAEPACPDAATTMADVLVWWGVLTAFAGGLLGITQSEPRRALASIAVTQSGLVMAGFGSMGASGNEGGGVQWVALGVSLVGMAIVLEAIEARLGADGARQARGLLKPLPGLALLFLVFGATATGFPGTLGFIGEDLVVAGVLEHSLLAAVLALVATALNGATLALFYARSFMGPVAPQHARLPRTSARERLVLVPLATFLAGLGLIPAALLETPWAR
jgi:NADH-quinone oxidoreductase subunit M